MLNIILIVWSAITLTLTMLFFREGRQYPVWYWFTCMGYGLLFLAMGKLAGLYGDAMINLFGYPEANVLVWGCTVVGCIALAVCVATLILYLKDRWTEGSNSGR